MKTKFLATIIVFLIIFSIGTVSVFAWAPDEHFYCWVDGEKMPEGAVYIDLLLPISTDDEAYVEYNEQNAEKYGISSSSEIVKYNADGYRSYTFHIVDAVSNMSPWYSADFSVSKAFYEENEEMFEAFGSDHISVIENDEYYIHGKIVPNSEKEQKLEQFKAIPEIEFRGGYDPNDLQVGYNSFDARYDFEYCCTKYKYAKMAYLDEDGNIISVSTKTKIYSKTTNTFTLGLKLSGNNFSSDIQTSPFRVLGFIVIAVAILIGLIVMGMIVRGIVFYIRKRKNANNKNLIQSQ